jgi:hypothetical protein
LLLTLRNIGWGSRIQSRIEKPQDLGSGFATLKKFDVYLIYI